MRFTEERWVGVAFSARTEQLPLADPKDGQPLHNADGSPKTAEHTILTFTHLNPFGQPELIVHVPFDQNAKQELLRQLTGGIVVPTNGSPAA